MQTREGAVRELYPPILPPVGAARTTATSGAAPRGDRSARWVGRAAASLRWWPVALVVAAGGVWLVDLYLLASFASP